MAQRGSTEGRAGGRGEVTFPHLEIGAGELKPRAEAFADNNRFHTNAIIILQLDGIKITG